MATRTQALADAVAAFAEHLRVERQASPHTLRAYVADVRQFLTAIEDVPPLARNLLRSMAKRLRDNLEDDPLV